MLERVLERPDGRLLRVYDSGAAGCGSDASLTLVWHHGTPQLGTPPDPLPATEGLRWVSIDRPGYGASAPAPGRDVAAVAADVAAVMDALAIDRFVVLGASGGGPHALACAALLPERVLAAACLACVAPFDAEGLDWFADMPASGAAEFHAASAGRSALEKHLDQHVSDEPDLAMFAPADLAAFGGPFAPWLVGSMQAVTTAGRPGWIDDDLAFVRPWGFDVRQVRSPLLLVHGGDDRVVPPAHLTWLAEHCPKAESRLEPDDGHISVFRHAAAAVEWLVRQSR